MIPSNQKRTHRKRVSALNLSSDTTSTLPEYISPTGWHRPEYTENIPSDTPQTIQTVLRKPTKIRIRTPTPSHTCHTPPPPPPPPLHARRQCPPAALNASNRRINGDIRRSCIPRLSQTTLILILCLSEACMRLRCRTRSSNPRYPLRRAFQLYWRTTPGQNQRWNLML